MTTNSTPSKTPQIINMVPMKGAFSVLTNQWFITSEYAAYAAGFAPLINGERAFKAIALAIKQAKKSINIVMWGFQASMYFTRGKNGKERVGDLLRKAAERGVKVRVLVWYTQMGDHFDPQFPGWGAYRTQKTDKNIFGEYIEGYSASGNRLSYMTREDYEYDKKWHYDVKYNKLGNGNLFVKHREFNWSKDKDDAKERLNNPPDGYPETSWQHRLALSRYPTHHQKVVVIDYEDPEVAVGFVMGHNMLSAYWDDDKHDGRQKAAYEGRDGERPWQDTSSCVCGGVLADLYHNFQQAWTKEVGIDNELNQCLSITAKDHKFSSARMEALNKRLELDSEFSLQPTMGQICRTQPQYNRFDVERVYQQAISTARNYIYMENQYFRYSPFVKTLTEAVKKRKAEGYHLPLYLFVVTNTTALEEMKVGSFTTYDMLKELKYPDLCPVFFKKDKLSEDEKNEMIEKRIPDLNTIICTLVSTNPDITQKSLWQPTYVHSKVLMVDDVFMTLGSSNINYRSMRFDSELNINIQDTDAVGIIKHMRVFLWRLHTGDISENLGENFKNWKIIVSRNKANKNTESYIKPSQSLIQFLDENTSWKKQE